MPKKGDIDNSIVNFLLENNKIELLEPYTGSKKHHRMKCLECSHEWTATPLSKKQTYKKNGVSGCPECNNTRKNNKYNIIRKERLAQLSERGIEILDESYDGRLRLDYKKALRKEKIKVRNTNCGHEFFVTPLNLIQSSVDCGVCGPQKRVEPLTAWSKANSEKWQETATEWEIYKSEVNKLTRDCYNQNKKKINPKKLKRGKAGVEGAYHLDHIVPIRFCFDNNIPTAVCADISNLQMMGWRDNVGSRDSIKGSVPPIFQPYIKSSVAIQQYAELIKKTIFPKAELFKKIGNTVAAVFDEETQHAVVIIPFDKTFADQKIAMHAMKQFQDNDVTYSFIFEDECADLDLITNKLSHYTSNSTLTRIHARKCVIREVSKKEKKLLLENNHVQGNDAGQINIGAFHDDELVAVMTFCKPRVALGNKNEDRSSYDDIWELSRFVTDTQYRIPGIASKLLKHFTNNYTWIKIFSFADMRWSTGNLYYKLGFELEATNKPAYFYIIDGKRKHRWNYRKDILKTTLPDFDAKLTEYQNMENHGFYRVWDCGTLKFVMHNV